MRRLGIYFGPQVISIVDIIQNQAIQNIQISNSVFSSGEILEDKVPEEVKIAALLKEEFKKNKLTIKDASFSLSGKDLIIRSFEIPILPIHEIEAAVNFEAAKYTPFKTQDLISDFQYMVDRTHKKIYILFAGIKKETLDKYIYIAAQSNLRLLAVEYAAFSVLRLVKLSNIKEKGIIGVMGVDITKNDEVNLVILENGFPLFSRDITLISGSSGFLENEEMVLDKLKREIRVSLDYYKNKNPFKGINKMLLIMKQNHQSDLEALIKDKGISVEFIDINKYIQTDKPLLSTLAFIKSYGTGLAGFKIGPKIDLLAAKERLIKKLSLKKGEKLSLFNRINLDPRLVIVTALICISASFFYYLYKVMPIKSELNNLKDMQPSVSKISKGASYNELIKTDNSYKFKIKAIENILNKRLYLTEIFDVVPRIVLDNMYLTKLTLKKQEDKITFILEGNINLENSSKEVEAVNTVLLRLKDDPIFNKYFFDTSITSINQSKKEEENITNFIITCQGREGWY